MIVIEKKCLVMNSFQLVTSGNVFIITQMKGFTSI